MEAVAAAIPDMPDEGPLMKERAVLLEETVAQPVVERLTSEANLRE